MKTLRTIPLYVYFIIFFGFAASIAAVPAFADPGCQSPDPQSVLQNYMEHVQAQRDVVESFHTRVTYDSYMDKNIQEAVYLRVESPPGYVKMVRLDKGDSSLPRDIRTAVEEDQKSTPQHQRQEEYTSENYNISFLEKDGKIDRYSLTPAVKRDSLLNGELWLNSETCEPIKVFGTPINHAPFVKQMTIQEEFQNVRGIYVSKRLLVRYRASFFGLHTVQGVMQALYDYGPRDVVLKTDGSGESHHSFSINR